MSTVGDRVKERLLPLRGDAPPRVLARRREGALLAGVWLATAVWVWRRLDQGWYPHDDGALAQSAARVLQGQLPHREFVELYTGAMTFLNAGAFLTFGENLFSLRIPLFVVFLGFVPCVYYVARQFVEPLPAALTAVVAVTWSIAVHPAATASWYLLMFSVYGAAALVRWRTTGGDHWLLVAGLLGGVALTFKIVGVYYLAAVVYFLVIADRPGDPGRPARARWGRIAAAVFGVAVVAGVLGSRIGVPEVTRLVGPIAVLTAALLTWPLGARSLPAFRVQAARLVTFGIGAGLPVALFLVPYLWVGGLGDLYEGVFVSPQSRRDVVYLALPGLKALIPAAAVAVLFWARPRLSDPVRKPVDVGVVTLLGLVLLLASVNREGYRFFWETAHGLAPIAVAGGSLGLILARRWEANHHDDLLILLLALAGFMALVQFPFAHPVYFCYFAPLVALAVVGVSSRLGMGFGVLPVAFLGAMALYGASYLDRSAVGFLADEYKPDRQVATLGHKASIRVYPETRAALTRITELVHLHGRGPYTFAGPDLPHVYFLTGLDNPTRSLFDFLDTSRSARGTKLLRTLREKHVTVIVVDHEPELSPALEPATVRALERRYPRHERIGDIDVRWH